MIVADLMDDMRAILGTCTDQEIFVNLTDAIELLSNEGQFDPLTGYMDLPVQSNYLVVLPPDVETPLRLNLNDNPSFARGRLFEFMLNGPGSALGPRVAFSFEDQGDSPTQTLLDATNTPLKLRSGAVGLIVSGLDQNGFYVDGYAVPITYDSAQFTAIKSVRNTFAGPANIALYATKISGGSEFTLSSYAVSETNPLYRVIRLSKTGLAVRMMYRRRTFQITSVNDYVPVGSRLSVLYMAKSIKRGLITDFNSEADKLQAKAVELITKEQNSRNAALALSEQEQIDRNLQTNLYAGNLITVRDVYDEAARIFGLIGEPSLMRKITDAVELASNKSNWDPLTAYLVLNVAQGLITLPSEVETILRVNVDSNPVFMRSQLYEFSLMGPDAITASNTESNWSNAGDSPVFVQPSNAQIYVSDVTTPMFVSGIDTNAAFIASYQPTGSLSGPTFAQISSVVIPGGLTVPTQLLSGSGATLLADYEVGDITPLYRQARLDKPASSARIWFRRRTRRLTSLDDIIFLHSRAGVVLMMQAMQLWQQTPANMADAQAMEARAVLALQEEQDTRNTDSLLADGEQDAPALGESINAVGMIVAGDLYDDAVRIYGKVGKTALLRFMWDAVEALSNKGNWDPMTAYLTVNVAQGLITLPNEVEEVLRVSVDGNPVFMRSQTYEFSLMGPDANTAATSEANWQDAGDSPVFNQPVTPMQIYVGNLVTPIYVSGYDENQQVIDKYLATDAAAGPLFSEITSVYIPTGLTTRTRLFASDSTVLGDYGVGDVMPIFRQIRLDRAAASAKLYFRRRTKRITSLSDIIFLNNRAALVLMMESLKIWHEPSGGAGGFRPAYESAQLLEDRALKALQDEQDSRNSGQALAAGEQFAPPLGEAMSIRDVILMGDIYDECAEITGPVGKRRMFDIVTNSIDMLANRAEWDSELGFADVHTTDGYTFALPREVGDVLEVNICGQPARGRNRWVEFHLNGPGRFDRCCSYRIAA